MKPMTRRFVLTLLTIVLTLGSVLVFEAAGSRGLFAPPTVVAVVDLKRVMDGLAERKQKVGALQAEAEKMQEESDRKQASIKGMEEQIKQAPEGEQQALKEEAALAVLNYQMWGQLQGRRMDAETAIHMEDLFKSIQEAIAELAEIQQYDLVLIDDSAATLGRDRSSKVPQENQIRQQIGMRRILYRTDAIDITDEVIDRMNNAFNAG